MSDSLWPHGAFQAPLSMGFSRQEYWSGMPLPSRCGKQFSCFCSSSGVCNIINRDFILVTCILESIFGPKVWINPWVRLWSNVNWKIRVLCPRPLFRWVSWIMTSLGFQLPWLMLNFSWSLRLPTIWNQPQVSQDANCHTHTDVYKCTCLFVRIGN